LILLDISVVSAIFNIAPEDGYFCVNNLASGLGLKFSPPKLSSGATHEAGRFV
jgi:hypothetical protein